LIIRKDLTRREMKRVLRLFGISSLEKQPLNLLVEGLRPLSGKGGNLQIAFIADDFKEGRNITLQVLSPEGHILKGKRDEHLRDHGGDIDRPFVGIGCYSPESRPCLFADKSRESALVFDGAIFNRKELTAAMGADPDTPDGLIALELYKNSYSPESGIRRIMEMIEGPYSLLILDGTSVAAIRDPTGLRPLLWGMTEGKLLFASESSSFVALSSNLIREVGPGEGLFAAGLEISSIRVAGGEEKRCVMELLTLARPESKAHGKSVYEFRKLLGTLLARAEMRKIDIAVPLPPSGRIPALAYSSYLRVPLEEALRSHGPGSPYPFMANPHVLEGKRIALIAAYLRSGHFLRKTAEVLREKGAREVHLRIASPPLVSSCPLYETDEDGEFIASSAGLREIMKHTGVDSIVYLSLRNLKRALGRDWKSFCLGCLDGHFPPIFPKKLLPAGILRNPPPVLRELEEKDLFGDI